MKTVPISKSNLVIIVDDEDFERINSFKWHLVGRKKTHIQRVYRRWIGYVVKVISVSIAHEVMQNNGVMYDHIDRNFLNNQKSNLRSCTPTQNNSNKAGKGLYKGVSWCKIRKGWRARVGGRSKEFYLGVFPSPEEAAIAYDAKAKELFGEFAYLNFPKSL